MRGNLRCQQLGVLDSSISVTFQKKLFLSLVLLIYAVQNTEIRLLRKAKGVEFRTHYILYREILCCQSGCLKVPTSADVGPH